MSVRTWGTHHRWTIRAASVASLAVVALRHPDGLHGLLACLDQIALGAIYRLENLNDGRPAHLPTFGSYAPAQRLGESGDLIQVRNSLTVDGFRKLFAAPARLSDRNHARGQSMLVQAKKRRAAAARLVYGV